MAEVLEPNQIPYGIDNEFAGEDKYTPRDLTNPHSEDFHFMWSGKGQVVKAKSTQAFPDFMAVHGAKKMAEWLCDICWPQLDIRNPNLNYTQGDMRDMTWHCLRNDFPEEVLKQLELKSSGEAKKKAAKAAQVEATKVVD